MIMTDTGQKEDWHNENGSDELLILSSSTGHSFMQFFTETLADCFEIDIVTIGELMVMEDERISVLAGSIDGKPFGDFDYQACVAPCSDVIQTGQPKVFLSSVQSAYPKDALFVDHDIHSYVGVPLINPEGEPIGVIQGSWRREIDQEEADHVLETIGLFVARLSAELVTLHAMRILSALVTGPDLTGNLDALRLLTEQMQTALKVRVAFIAECLDEDDSRFRLLAYCQDGKLLSQAEGEIIPYEGVPCCHLKKEEVFLVRSGLQEAFPTQTAYKAHNLVSYLGQNIRDDAGKVIGHFALQHDRELLDRTLKADLFKLFAARVSLELRKYQSEQKTTGEASTLPAAYGPAPNTPTNTNQRKARQKLTSMQEQVHRLQLSLDNSGDAHVSSILQDLQAELTQAESYLR